MRSPGRLGSTPLARGTRRKLASAFFKTAVQPRSRGELYVSAELRDLWRGSTPLARGTRNSPERDYFRLRFNPARAGNSIHSLRAPRKEPVQPRSRGELKNKSRPSGIPDGSTPLARGTRHTDDTPSVLATVQPRSRGELR